MGHILQPPSESVFALADALAKTPRCILLLEEAVLHLVSDFGSDVKRARARKLARPLLSGCPDCGFREASNIVRMLVGTLALSPGGSPELQTSIAERLLDLVSRLKAIAQKNKAKAPADEGGGASRRPDRRANA